MRSRQILALLCAVPLALTGLGCSNRALRVSRATPPSGVEASSYTSRMMQLAERYEEQGNHEGALRLYRQIAAADPGQSQVQERISAITKSVAQPSATRSETAVANASRSAPQSARIRQQPQVQQQPVAGRQSVAGQQSVSSQQSVAERRTVEPPAATAAISHLESPAPRTMPATEVPTVSEPLPPADEDPAFAEWIRTNELAQTSRSAETSQQVEPESGAPEWWADASPQTETVDVPAWAAEATSDEEDPTSAWNRTSLVRLCPEADEELQFIVTHLEEQDDDVRKEALMFIASLGAEGRPALPAVDALLSEPDELVQAHAAWTIWSVGDRGDRSVTTLASLAQSERDDVVQLAAFFLGCIGADAGDAESVLRRARDETTGATRLHLAEALVRINPEDLVSLNELARGLQDEDPALRWLSAVALTGISPKQAPWIVPALTARLEDSEPSVCSAAALTLGSLGPAAHTAAGPLAKATTHDTPDVRLAAEAALACIQH